MRSSPLALRANEFERDYPTLEVHARTRAKEVLATMNRTDLDPDHLILKVFIEETPEQPATTRHLSMTQLALLSLSKKSWSLLTSVAQTPKTASAPVSAEVLIQDAGHGHGHVKGTHMTPAQLVEAVDKTLIASTYSSRLKSFWAQHSRAYQAIAKLAYADSLSEHVKLNPMTLEGYNLALNAADLADAIPSYAQLTKPHLTDLAFISSVHYNGRIIPGVVQIQSLTSSKTLLYLPGHSPTFIEFNNPAEAKEGFKSLVNTPASRKSLAPYLNAAKRRAAHPDDAKALITPRGLFEHLSAGLLQSSLKGLDRRDSLDAPWLKNTDPKEVFQPINRSLAMIGSTDTWALRHDLKEKLPSPLRLAARFMREHLHNHYPGKLSPNKTFIQYIPGTKRTSLGGSVEPIAFVPSEKPLSLTQALLNNYRVETPGGYRDIGGKTVVFVDETGQGRYTPGSEVPIKPADIAGVIANAHFNERFSKALALFWTANAGELERFQRGLLNSQAIDSLESKTLTPQGLRLIASAAEQGNVQVSALGFRISQSPLQSFVHQTSQGLIEFSAPDSSLVVLYEAAGNPAYHEFENRTALEAYIRQATMRPAWREAFLNSIPNRNRAGAEYVLNIWASEQSSTRTPKAGFGAMEAQGQAYKADALILRRKSIQGDLSTFILNTSKETMADNAQEQITTNAELRATFWSGQLDKLQLVLFPFALAFAPAAVASIAVGGLQIGLNLYTALSPETSQSERAKATRGVILGGLSALPASRHIAKAFRKYAITSKLASQPKLTSHFRVYKGDEKLASWLLARTPMVRKNPLLYVRNLAEVKKYDFKVPALVYRAHVGTHTATTGLRRASGASAVGDDYLAAIIQHTARTGGSKGEVLSLAAERATSVKFVKPGTVIQQIDTTLAPPRSFRTAADIILTDGPRLVEKGKLTRSTLLKAVDNLKHHNEQELFYIAGDIPAKYLL